MLHSLGSQEADPTLPARQASVLLHHPYRNFEEASYQNLEAQEAGQKSLGLWIASVPEAFSDDPDPFDGRDPVVAVVVGRLAPACTQDPRRMALVSVYTRLVEGLRPLAPGRGAA